LRKTAGHVPILGSPWPAVCDCIFMMKWAVGFLIVAMIAAVLGFSRISDSSSDAARICFYFFLAGFAFALVWGLVKRRRFPPRPRN
jgi:uncharacterized membrane protein YtjA (UPF0391 family)